MTMQILDRVRYQRRKYELLDLDGEGYFNPVDHGLQAISPHTACWRGFICTYVVISGSLVLRELDINLREPTEFDDQWDAPFVEREDPQAPAFNGVSGMLSPEYGFSTRYKKVELPLPFTGKFVIARKEKRGLPFPYHWQYLMLLFDEVRELSFEKGKLTADRDLSEEAAARRAEALGDWHE